MANVPTRFFSEAGFTRLPDVIEQLFRESFVMPRFDRFIDIGKLSNLLETEEAFVVQLLLPGVDPTKVDLHVVGSQLTIKAVYDIPTIENARFIWQGLVAEEFVEIFTLPMDVDGEKAVAVYDRGILTVTLPKMEYAKPKAIKVSLPG